MLEFSDPVSAIPLVGEKYQALLKNLGIETVKDLIQHYPSRYEDRRRVCTIAELTSREAANVRGEILEIRNSYTKHGKLITRAEIRDDTGTLSVIWFNQAYLTRALRPGDQVNLFGALGFFDRRPALISPQYERLTRSGPDSNRTHTQRLAPVYPETKGVSSKWLRSRIQATLKVLQGQSQSLNTQSQTLNSRPGGQVVKRLTLEWLPEEILNRESLMGYPQALQGIHFPESWEELGEAKKRLAFDEMFLFQLQALLKKREWGSGQPAPGLPDQNQLTVKEFLRTLPFELTGAQKRCAEEIGVDLHQTAPMNRLLQGDVGSGKTVVAAVAALKTLLAGHNVLYMAPTQVLAEQQYRVLEGYFRPYPIRVELLTGNHKLEARSKKQVVHGKQLIVGTHALLHRSEQFENVALVIIDEQHRFGVEQRTKLLYPDGKLRPHLLTMTATPIPRSLALTSYGHLDLSFLDEMPVGRKPVTTWVVPERKRPGAYQWIREQIHQHQTQAFFICPFIEPSEHENLENIKAATEEFERLQSIFPDLRLELLHGKIKPADKDRIITSFCSRKFDVLVSTPVVEVGVDIPNANLMVIEGGERFGLASLHQLRGRVGRNSRQAYCLIFTTQEGPETTRRLKAVEKHHSGIKLAEIDLGIRGPGELYGTAQHGFLEFKLASLTDLDLIHQTRQVAGELLPKLEEYPTVRGQLQDH